MNLSDRDLEALVRAACPPLAPPEALRARVLLAASPRRAAARRALRALLPYAAGIVSVLAAQRVLASPGRPAGPDPAAPFASIADRPPVSSPEPEPAAEPESSPVAFAPVPRIS